MTDKLKTWLLNLLLMNCVKLYYKINVHDFILPMELKASFINYKNKYDNMITAKEILQNDVKNYLKGNYDNLQ